MFNITIEPAHLVSNGVCDQRNSYYVANALAAYISLLDDSPLFETIGKKPLVTYEKFSKLLLNSPVRDVVSKYSQLADSIMTDATLTDTPGDRSVFHIRMKETPIFMEYYHWWHSGDPLLLRYILTFLRFLKKMNYVDENLDQIAFRDWTKIEDKLSAMSFNEERIMRLLKRVISYLITDPETNNATGHFGPGAVSEAGVHGPIDKSYDLSFDPKLSRVLLDSTITKSANRGVSLESAFRNLDAARAIRTKSQTVGVSRLMFVPKDVTKSRSICMEPNSYMFAQQMVLQWYMDTFDTGPMCNYVDLRDQTRNQQGAQYGSVTGALDTIDLSSASDTLHVSLIRQLFPKSWQYYLLGTRVSNVRLPNGLIRKIVKFAPMGSALCFPTQCVMFTAIVLVAYLLWFETQGFIDLELQLLNMSDSSLGKFLEIHIKRLYEPSDSYNSQRLESPTIYGDDILCDSRVTIDVERILTSLGFLMNSSKSFMGSQCFRESCGKYYHQGDDVTPLLYKVAHSTGHLHPVRYASLIGHANLAYSYNYNNLRSAYIRDVKFASIGRYVLRSGRKTYRKEDLLPYTTDPNQFGFVVQRLRSFPVNRINTDLQRNENLTLGIRQYSRRLHKSDNSFYRYEAYAYYLDSLTRYKGARNENSHMMYRPEETRFCVGWTPRR